MTSTEETFQGEPSTAELLDPYILSSLALVGLPGRDPKSAEQIDGALAVLPAVITPAAAENIFLGVKIFVEENPPSQTTDPRLVSSRHANAVLNLITERAEANGNLDTVAGITEFYRIQAERERRPHPSAASVAGDRRSETTRQVKPLDRVRRFLGKIGDGN